MCRATWCRQYTWKPAQTWPLTPLIAFLFPISKTEFVGILRAVSRPAAQRGAGGQRVGPGRGAAAGAAGGRHHAPVQQEGAAEERAAAAEPHAGPRRGLRLGVAHAWQGAPGTEVGNRVRSDKTLVSLDRPAAVCSLTLSSKLTLRSSEHTRMPAPLQSTHPKRARLLCCSKWCCAVLNVQHAAHCNTLRTLHCNTLRTAGGWSSW